MSGWLARRPNTEARKALRLLLRARRALLRLLKRLRKNPAALRTS